MQMTFRWFGKEKDTVSLEQIRQIPVICDRGLFIVQSILYRHHRPRFVE